MNFENVSKFKKYNILFVVCKQSMKFWNNKYGVFLAKYNKQSQKSRKVIVTGDFNLDYAKKYRPDYNNRSLFTGACNLYEQMPQAWV